MGSGMEWERDNGNYTAGQESKKIEALNLFKELRDKIEYHRDYLERQGDEGRYYLSELLLEIDKKMDILEKDF